MSPVLSRRAARLPAVASTSSPAAAAWQRTPLSLLSRWGLFSPFLGSSMTSRSGDSSTTSSSSALSTSSFSSATGVGSLSSFAGVGAELRSLLSSVRLRLASFSGLLSLRLFPSLSLWCFLCFSFFKGGLGGSPAPPKVAGLEAGAALPETGPPTSSSMRYPSAISRARVYASLT